MDLSGFFSIFFQRTFGQAFEKIVPREYLKAGGDFIITSCPGCMMQLAKVIRDRPIIHLIELVEEAMFQEKEPVNSNNADIAQKEIHCTCA